ncbi:MAG: hypothetical protein WAN82_06185 [Candidatus Bathyarchaeia archaeon]
MLIALLRSKMEQMANQFFKAGQSAAEHDNFFGRFTPIWLDLVQKRRYFEAISFLNEPLVVAYKWESMNKPHTIHKGTPYYFLGVTAILNNELENGFLLMHQALEEDKRLSPNAIPKTPAYFFVTLDYKEQGQFFRQKVEEISDYLAGRIDTYVNKRNGTLTLEQFKAKFLECLDLNEEVFLFVFVLFETHKMILGTNERLKKNPFSSLIHARILSNLCIIFDKTVEHKHPDKGSRPLFISDEIIFLSKKATSSIDDAAKGEINHDFQVDFSKTLRELLGSTYRLSLSDIENDLAIAYGIRNFCAHKIEDQPVLYNNFDELCQRLMNALFFALEKL